MTIRLDKKQVLVIFQDYPDFPQKYPHSFRAWDFLPKRGEWSKRLAGNPFPQFIIPSMSDIIPWQQSGWLTSAHSWINAELARQKIVILGVIEQPHIRPWSTVMRVLTNAGYVYFKASAFYLGHEAALTEFLATKHPRVAPDLISVDKTRHWLLMHDSGTPLRDFIKSENSIGRWMRVLPLYVNVQKSLIPYKGELLSLGVFDRRLDQLPTFFQQLLKEETAMLLDRPESLTSFEYRRLLDIEPKFSQMCSQLAGYGIPETLHHDDFHDGNIFIQDERVIITDWGESAVAHPFFSLVVMLRSVENSLELSPDSTEVETLRCRYLSLWREYAPLVELQKAVRLAQMIGYINRALTWQTIISHLPESLKTDYAIAVPSYLNEFVNNVDEG